MLGVTSETMVLQLADHTVVVERGSLTVDAGAVLAPARARAGAPRSPRRATRRGRVEASVAAPGVGTWRNRRTCRRGDDRQIAAAAGCRRRGHRNRDPAGLPAAVGGVDPSLTAESPSSGLRTRAVRVNDGRHDRSAPSMTARHLLVESEGDIITITLDRPEKRNALALDVMLELTETFEHVGESDALGVVLAANGPVFSAGHNFGDMAGASIDDAAPPVRGVHDPDGHGPVDPAAGDRPRPRPGDRRRLSARGHAAISRSRRSRRRSPSPAARVACSATHPSSPSPATSVGSGRSRWR